MDIGNYKFLTILNDAEIDMFSKELYSVYKKYRLIKNPDINCHPADSYCFLKANGYVSYVNPVIGITKSHLYKFE